MKGRGEGRVNRYPFSAIVGQSLLKRSLIYNAVDGSIGGVLIFGQRGTAKSTAVRALADLLPEIDVVDGCPFKCDPHDPDHMCEDCRSSFEKGTLKITRKKMKVVDLPVSSTEDKVTGSLDISRAMKEGVRAFEPGVLAEANRNILYVDEINLLNDHLVDTILDSAAMGVNTVEREGISFSHPSRFILVGTMNPEEGDLRPQLLDRFGLAVYIEGESNEKKRITILRRLMDRDSDPMGFMERWRPYDERISKKIVDARERLSDIRVDESMFHLAIDKVLEAHAEGHRADTIIMKTAIAIAAYDGRDAVEEKDIELAAALALAHRSRDPPQPPPQEEEPEEEDEEEPPNDDQQNEENHEDPPPPQEDDTPTETEQQEIPDVSDDDTVTFKTGAEFKIRSNAIPKELRVDNIVRSTGGRRTETESENGRYVGYRVPHGRPSSLAFDATIRAAASHQIPGSAFTIRESDIREKVRERKIGNLIVFVVDASGSMGTEQRMTAVKGAISSILTDAYQKRDRVSLVVFRGKGAETVVPPTNSIVLAKEKMNGIPTGGRTPLAAGLENGHSVIMRELTKDRKIKPLMVVVSDGRGNVSTGSGDPKADAADIAGTIAEYDYPALVIDSEVGFLKLGLAQRLAENMHAKYMKLEDLKADTVMDAVKAVTTADNIS